MDGSQVKKIRYKKLPAVWIHLYDTLKEAKLQTHKTGHSWPGAEGVKRLSAKGPEEFWGVKQLSYVPIVVVVTWLCVCQSTELYTEVGEFYFMYTKSQ